MMKGRVLSIDVLRAIAITGMVLCASIGWNSNLPAWMFHAQVPPPDYIFNPNVPGITWVDLVFPFFIFSMGAAIPFSLGRRLDKGEKISRIVMDLFHRWFSLTVFAIMLGNASSIAASSRPAFEVNIMRVLVWIMFFMLFVKLRTERKVVSLAVKTGGIVLMVIIAFALSHYFGVTLSLYSSDIIILILANLVLFGGMLWILTRKNHLLRSAILFLFIVFKALDAYAPQLLAWVPSCGCIEWLFQWRFLQYMILVIPASMAGDIIMRYFESADSMVELTEDSAGGVKSWTAVMIIPFVIVFQLWALFSRYVWLDLVVTICLGIVFYFLVRSRNQLWNNMGICGFIALFVGIVMDPVDGGITKDPCNLSFLFTTGGIALMTTSFLLFFESGRGLKCDFLVKVGQNPMIAYTLRGYVICPLLYITGILEPLDRLTIGSPFFGLMRGALVTVLMLLITYVFSRFRIYWRS